MFNLYGNKSLQYEEIIPQQAEQRIKSSRPLVIDVREPYEYAQGHIQGSKLIPLRNLGARLNELGPKEQEIILVCRSGSRSGMAARQLSASGYKKVFNLSGGIVGWLRAGLAIHR